jgi:hypothetical protein
MSDAVTREEFDKLKEQHTLAVELLVQVHQTLIQITQGREVLQIPKDGMEDVVSEYRLRDNSPKYKLVRTKTPKPSKILGNNGTPLVHTNGEAK